MQKEAKARILINDLLSRSGWRFFESERAIVEANRKLIEIYEKKIQDKLAEIWGEGD